MKPRDVSNHLRNKLDIMIIPSNIDRWRNCGILDVKTNDKGQYDYSNDDLAKIERIVLLRRLGFSRRDIIEYFKGNTLIRDAVKNSVMACQEKWLPAMDEMVTNDGL